MSLLSLIAAQQIKNKIDQGYTDLPPDVNGLMDTWNLASTTISNVPNVADRAIQGVMTFLTDPKARKQISKNVADFTLGAAEKLNDGPLFDTDLGKEKAPDRIKSSDEILEEAINGVKAVLDPDQNFRNAREFLSQNPDVLAGGLWGAGKAGKFAGKHLGPKAGDKIEQHLTDIGAIKQMAPPKRINRGSMPEADSSGFTSPTEGILHSIKQDKFQADQLISTKFNDKGKVTGYGGLLASRGAPIEELKQTGLLTFIENNKGKTLTKDQLIGFLNENKPQFKTYTLPSKGLSKDVVEDLSQQEFKPFASDVGFNDEMFTMLGEYLDDFSFENFAAKGRDPSEILSKGLINGALILFDPKAPKGSKPYIYSDLTAEGVGYYSDPIIKRFETEAELSEYIRTGIEFETRYGSLTQPGLDYSKYVEIPVFQSNAKNNIPFIAPEHYGGDNLAFHLRGSGRTDVTGKNTFLIEETQSDWNTWKRKTTELNKTSKLDLEELRKNGPELFDDNRDMSIDMMGYELEKESRTLEDWQERYNKGEHVDHEVQMSSGRLDDIKREIKRLEESSYAREKEKLKDLIEDSSKALSDRGKTPLENSKWTSAALMQAINYAKNNGYKRVALPSSDMVLDVFNSKRREVKNKKTGEYEVQYQKGYQKVYDQDLRKAAKKWANQNNSEFGKTQIDFDGTKKDVFYIDINDEMIKRIEEKGLPLFSKKKDSGLLGFA